MYKKATLKEDVKVGLAFDDDGQLQNNVVLKKGSAVFIKRYSRKGDYVIQTTDQFHPINGFKIVFQDMESLEKVIKENVKKWF